MKILKKKWVQLILGLLFVFMVLPLPNPLFKQPYATTLETREGELLGAMIATDGQWRFPASDSVPKKFEEAIRLFEDEYFFQHFGVNPVSIVKAFIVNVRHGEIKRGGSTLSMQVVRMARGNQPRNVWQKALETLLAFKLELFYSKEEILGLYASHAPFGGNVVGLDAASWRYFGRPATLLSWAEAASLAVLPNSPSLIFPGKNEDIFRLKRNSLLEKLQSRGLMDSMTCILSKAEELPGKPKVLPRAAPRLLTRAIKEGRTGERNIVTLDASLQAQITSLTQNHMRKWEANYVHNAAVLVIEIETGEAKAYVGNIDSDEIHGQSVDIITAPRSTGSLLKPFLYAAAIDEGLIAPRQLLKDYPIFFEGFSPKNFDLKYRGAVHADEALTRSLNLPFVLLLREYGIEKFHQKLKRIGMDHLRRDPDHYGLSLVLGGAESTLWEMVNMYANVYRVYHNSFSQGITELYDSRSYGQHTYLASEKIKYSSGQYQNELSISSIWSTLEALKGVHRPDEFAGWEQFRSYTPISWKTGTSFGFRDAWSIGIDGKYAVGVWVGNADGEGRPGLVGGQAAAPLMFQVFERLDARPLDDVPTAETQQFQICRLSGQKAGPYCEQMDTVSLPASVDKSQSCSYHQLVHLDKKKQYQVNSSCYDTDQMEHVSWFVLPPVQAWYYRQYNANYQSLPRFQDGCQEGVQSGHMEMIYPVDYAEIFIPVEIDGRPGRSVFEAAHSNVQAVIHWHMDGEYLESTQREHVLAISGEPGIHHLHLVDEDGQELNLTFTILGDD